MKSKEANIGLAGVLKPVTGVSSSGSSKTSGGGSFASNGQKNVICFGDLEKLLPHREGFIVRFFVVGGGKDLVVETGLDQREAKKLDALRKLEVLLSRPLGFDLLEIVLRGE